MLKLINILNEAKKEDILVNKIGIQPEIAKPIVDICGSLSVFLTNKYISYNLDNLKKTLKPEEFDEFLKNIKTKVIPSLFKPILFSRLREDLATIIDFVRVGLHGNIQTLKDKDFQEILDASEKWHDELKVGDGKVNYNEKGNILLDFRDKNGIGFYWVDLNTNDSREECERMGHCGKTNYSNTIVSLREVKEINGYKINESHLTAAIGKEDGIIYQLKGKKNSKPEKKYYPYIVELLLSDNLGIKGFGSEYDSNNDFHLTDLTEDEIKIIYQKKPELFTKFRERKILSDIGLIEKLIPYTKVKIFIDPRSVDGIIDNKTTIDLEKLIEEPWELFDYFYDYRDIIKYCYDDIDNENSKKIKELIKTYIVDNEINIKELDIDEDTSELDFIDEIGFDDLINTIGNSISEAKENQMISDYQKNLKEALEEYGEVEEFSYSGVTISVELKDEIERVLNDYPEDFEDIYDFRCNGDLECIFYEFIGDGFIEKPRFHIDSRYAPYVRKGEFNSILNYRLSEL